MLIRSFLLLMLVACGVRAASVEVIGHRTIYRDDRFYASFPSVVRTPAGEILVAFRRAPERRLHGATKVSHTDANSYLVLSRSGDEGKTWTPPELLFAHPLGGSQDPCLVQLANGALLCTSYAWMWLDPAIEHRHAAQMSWHQGNFAFLGGFTLLSADNARSWQGPYRPLAGQGERRVDVFGEPIPAYNRGAPVETRDGRLLWAVAVQTGADPRGMGVHLLISEDKGRTWKYSCPIAQDAKVSFNETSLYETPAGEIVAFLRTANFDDQLCVARSVDGGKSFQRWQGAGFKGHPAHALALPDQRVLLVYGYRHRPFGIRARILNPECTDTANAEEIILRDDGGTVDLGYPWSCQLSDGRALVVYYFNQADGTRTIEGTELSIR